MILCKYEKKGAAAYTPHLDMMRGFVMALRRVGIKIRYSDGFNPHPRIYLSPPPPVGTASGCEYFTADAEGTAGEFMEKLDGRLPPGVRVLKTADSAVNPNFAALPASAEYEVVTEKAVRLPDFSGILNASAYEISYAQKGETLTKDVRSMIYALAGGGNTYTFKLSYGNPTLRADRLMSWLLKLAGEPDVYFTVAKTRMFDKEGRDIDAWFAEHGIKI